MVGNRNIGTTRDIDHTTVLMKVLIDTTKDFICLYSPSSFVLLENVEVQLREFLHRGGKLLIMYEDSLPDELLDRLKTYGKVMLLEASFQAKQLVQDRFGTNSEFMIFDYHGHRFVYDKEVQKSFYTFKDSDKNRILRQTFYNAWISSKESRLIPLVDSCAFEGFYLTL